MRDDQEVGRRYDSYENIAVAQDRQRVDLVLDHQRNGFVCRGIGRNAHDAFRHDRANRRVAAALECSDHIVAGDDSDEPTVAIHHRHVANCRKRHLADDLGETVGLPHREDRLAHDLVDDQSPLSHARLLGKKRTGWAKRQREGVALLLACTAGGWESSARADEPPANASEEESASAREAYDEPIDVEVRGPPTPPDATTLSGPEAKRIPGAFGDPFRAIEALPGVVPLVSGVPYFYVRGSPPGNVGYFLDGIRVPLLFHMGLGPSVIHPAFISEVELSPGPVPSVGRASAGAVMAGLTEPSGTVRAEGSIRAVDTGAFVEAPFDEGRGAAMAGGRVSYAGWLFSVAQSSTSLGYWDYAARVVHEPSSGSRISIFGFGAFDYLSEKQEKGDDVRLFDTTFHRVDLRFDQTLDPRTELRYDLILGWDQTGLDVDREVVDKLLQLKATLLHQATEDVTLKGGLDFSADDFRFDLDRGDDEGFVQFFAPRLDLSLAAWLQAPLRLGSRLSLLPGVRAEVFASSGEVALALDPSIAAELEVTRGVALVHAHGLASQMPSFIVAGPGFRPGLDQGGLQRALHTSGGLVLEPERWGETGPTKPAVWTVKAIGYRVGFIDLNDALGTSPLSGEGFPDGFGDFDQRYLGTSTGLELSVRRRLTEGFGMIAAYTLGKSDRFAGTRRLPSGFDRTHVASAAFSYDFGAGFGGGLRNLFYTGTPLIKDRGTILVVSDRLAPFYRLDWRFEKKWRLGPRGFITVVAEVANTFLAKEQIGESCDFEIGHVDGQPVILGERCSPTTLGPVTIPSLGVEGGY